MNYLEKKEFLNELKLAAIREMRKQDWYKCVDGVICLRISHPAETQYCGMNVDEIDKCMEKFKDCLCVDVDIVNKGVADGCSKYDGLVLYGFSVMVDYWFSE